MFSYIFLFLSSIPFLSSDNNLKLENIYNVIFTAGLFSYSILGLISLVLINLDMCYGSEADVYAAFKLLRGTTVVTTATDLQGSCQSSTFGANQYHATNLTHCGYSFLDSPSTTSATTYKIQVRPMATTSRTFYLNRPENTSDANRFQATTTLTAIEIGA